MKSRLLGAAPLLVACALLSPERALAQKPSPAPRSVGVLTPLLGHDVPKRVAGELATRVLAGFERGAGEVRALASAEDCDEDCQRAAGQAAKVDLVVRVKVGKVGPDFKITIEAMDPNSGEVAGQVRGICEICGDEELLGRASDLAASLQARLENGQTNLARLSIRGTPSGAELYVDGERVGTTPFQGSFAPGDHELELRLPGYAPQSQQWSAARGVLDELDFQLSPSGKRQRDKGPRAFAKPLGWTFVAAGIAATGLGVGLLVLDERPHQRTCLADLQDPDGDCPFRYKTLAGGAASLALGIAAVGAGTGLLVWHGKGKHEFRARLRLGPSSATALVNF